MRTGRTFRRGIAGVALGTALAAAACAPDPPSFDRAGLEAVEDRTEALANDLLAFSVAVRDRDREAMTPYLADPVAWTDWGTDAPAEEPLLRGISHRRWPPVEAIEASREATLDRLGAFLDRFAEIDDARFKVKGVTFDADDPREGEAHLKFFLVGRADDGRREWVKGLADARVRRDGDGPWTIVRFAATSMESKLSATDLFSEVGPAAGIRATFPPFGVGRNRGFVAHGAAVADVDGDGWLDIAATGVERNYLYRNRGDGTFEEIGGPALVAAAPIGSGALFLDYDRDGDPDLFLAAVGRQVLLENRFVPDGRVVFWDVSDRAGVDREAVGFSAVAADVDGNGFTDVYVTSYNHYGTVMPNSWHRATNGTPNLLFLNRGDGTFAEEAAARGVEDPRWSYAAEFVDVDGDRDADLYVANDFGENALYRNDGGRFVDVAAEMGIVDPGFGMGVSFGDFDNDGDLDLHVTNMSSTAGNRILSLLYPEGNEIRRTLGKQAAGNSLYRNEGDGTFREVSDAVGGLSGGWAFGGGFADFDNDGWEDLYTPNGFVSGKSMKDT